MGFLDGLLDYGFKWLGNETIGLSKAQKEQNAWQSKENLAAFERESAFNAKMMEQEQVWQEEMYEKYNSLSGKIAQAEEAGVNPLFAVTGSATTPMTASSGGASASASSSGSSSGSRPTGFPVDLVQSFLGLSKVQAEVDNINAQTALYQEQAMRERINNLTLSDINQATLANIWSEKGMNDANKELLVSKALTEATTRDEQVAHTQLFMEQAITESKSREQIDANIRLIGSQIANMEADAWYKVQLAGLAIKQQVTEMYKWDEIAAQASWLTADIDRIAAATNESEARAALIALQQDTEKWHTAEAKRNYKWAPVNNVASIACNLTNSVANVIGSVKGMPSIPFTTRGTSDVTHYDGNIPPERGRVGFR